MRELRRIGKRIAIGLDGDLWLVLHLMIAGRLHWKPRGARLAGKYNLAAFDFPNGTLLFTEAGSKRRAALYLLHGGECADTTGSRGLEVLSAAVDASRRAPPGKPHSQAGADRSASLQRHRQRVFRRNPAPCETFAPADVATHSRTGQRLWDATQSVLKEWIDRLREQAADSFPEKVTAFRPEMAVHGRFGQPCPVCGAPVQRIRYADNETNYCPGCQTGGRILADRSLSRLLKDDWPRHLDEL